MVYKRLTEHVYEMKETAELLIPYTFPRVDFNKEQEVLLLKQRTITIDGYDVIVCYSKADYGENYLESLQIQSAFSPFLPFVVVCKLGRAFLGLSSLSYIEFVRNNRKVYCWTLKSRDGRPFPPDKNTKPGGYEGFKFHILNPGSVDLF